MPASMRTPWPPATIIPTACPMAPGLLSQILQAFGKRDAFTHPVFTIINAGKHLDVTKSPGVAFKRHLLDVFFLNFTAGPLDIQNTAGIKAVAVYDQLNLSAVILHNLCHQKARAGMEAQILRDIHSNRTAFDVLLKNLPGHRVAGGKIMIDVIKTVINGAIQQNVRIDHLAQIFTGSFIGLLVAHLDEVAFVKVEQPPHNLEQMENNREIGAKLF